MRYVLMTEPQQGMSYADHVAIARRAETNGFEAFLRSDHYASFPGAPGQPTTDAWTVVAGLARDTERIGLGVLVSPVTFRHPGALAKVVITADEMSGGRIEVGVGAGWNELEGSLFRPRPVAVAGRPSTPVGGVRPRIIVGGSGSPRSYRLAARYADEFNLSSASPERAAEVGRLLDDACSAIGRDPATLTRSTMAGVLVGRTDAEVAARERALLATFGQDAETGDAWLDERRSRWVHGTPDAARAQVSHFAEAGIERVMLQDFLPWDLDHVDVMGEELVGPPDHDSASAASAASR